MPTNAIRKNFRRFVQKNIFTLGDGIFIDIERHRYTKRSSDTVLFNIGLLNKTYFPVL